MCNYPKKASGFTLLELMVTIAVASVLIGLAIPSFSDMMRNNRLTTYTNELVTALNLARSEAVKRGTTVTVAAVAQGTGSSYWSTSGWNVFVDNSNPKNNIFDAGTDTLIKTYAAPPSSIVIEGNNNFSNSIRYRPDGTLDTTVGGSFAICADVPIPTPTSYAPQPYTSRLITVNNAGRIRIATDVFNASGQKKPDGIPEKDNSTSQLSDCMSP